MRVEGFDHQHIALAVAHLQSLRILIVLPYSSRIFIISTCLPRMCVLESYLVRVFSIVSVDGVYLLLNLTFRAYLPYSLFIAYFFYTTTTTTAAATTTTTIITTTTTTT